MKKIDSIQEQTKVIEAVFIQLEKIRETNDFSYLIDFHKIFWQLKQCYPEHFKRLMFDTNRHTPISEDLLDIFGSFVMCGIRYWVGLRIVVFDLEHCSLKEICRDLSVHESKIEEISYAMNLLIKAQEH